MQENRNVFRKVVVPLANSGGQLQVPTAQAGRVYDPSAGIASLGEMAANSMRMAAEAADNMGKAITLIQRQNEDLKAKQAYLDLAQELTDAQTLLEQQQGLNAETFRNGEYQKMVDKAQAKFNNVMNELNYSDIRNEYVENSIETGMKAAADADNYAYRQKLGAHNEMSKEIMESYNRQAREYANQLTSPIDAIRNEANRQINKLHKKTVDEAMQNATLNGLIDPQYLKLKSAEASDNFHVSVTEQLATKALGGLNTAQDYLEAHKGQMTSAAYTKGKNIIDEANLVDELMKNPGQFIKGNGEYDMILAEHYAPSLRDDERRRIVTSAIGTKAGSGKTATPEELAAFLAIGDKENKVYRNAQLSYGQIGDDKEYFDELKKNFGEKRAKELIEEYRDNRKLITTADMYKKFRDSAELFAKTPIVLNRNTKERELPPLQGEWERQKWLQEKRNDPNYIIYENPFALTGHNLYKEQKKFEDYIDTIGYKHPEDMRGIITDAPYSYMDAVVESFQQLFPGLPSGAVVQVMRDIANTQQATRPVFDKQGKEIGLEYVYKDIIDIDLWQKGIYDALQTHEKTPQLEALDMLFVNSVNKAIASGDRQQLIDSNTSWPSKLHKGDFLKLLEMRERAKSERDVRWNPHTDAMFWALR